MLARFAFPSSPWRRLLLALFVLCPTPSLARTALVMTDEKQSYLAGNHVEILEDRSKEWTLSDVASGDMDSEFRPSTTKRVRLGYSSSAFWVRLRISNRAAATTDWMLAIRTGQIDHIDVYLPRGPDREYRTLRTGAALPFASREVPDRQYVFRLPEARWADASGPLSTPDNYTVYLRLEGRSSIAFFPVIFSTSRYIEIRQKELLLLGMFYGTLILAIIVHLFTFLMTREWSYLHYVSFISVCVLGHAIAEGLIQQYVWPDHLVLPRKTLLLLLGLSVPLLLVFGASFLRTRTRLPGWHVVIKVLMAMSAAWLLTFPFGTYEFMAKFYRLLGLLSLLTVVTAGLLVWRQGHRPARYFSIAWMIFLGSFVFIVSGVQQRIADVEVNFAYIGLSFAFVLTTLVFALGLADRVKWQRERDNRERERLFAELEAKNAELERFTYSVSHDLKSPLVTIKGFLGFLKKDVATGDPERIAQDVSRIETAAESMRHLLDDLLELSRVGRVVRPPESVSLNAVVRDALELTSGRLEEAGAEVRVASDLPSAFCDRKRITEVFQNLIDNAVKFAGDRAGLSVTIGARTQGDMVLCYVKDDGKGIAPKYHEKVFDLFERLDAAEEGTGIGLALAKRIVEEHQGRIWVESEGLGHGSTLCFTLPKDRPGAAA